MKLLTIKITVLFALVFTLTEFGCEDLMHDIDTRYQVPELINDGIEVGEAAGAGIDTNYLQEASKQIQKGRFNELHSMLIYKNNKLV